MATETGLHHTASDLPARFVRVLLSECGFEPSGAELVEMLDRLAEPTGARAAAREAAELARAMPDLDPALGEALVRRALEGLGIRVPAARAREALERERGALAG